MLTLINADEEDEESETTDPQEVAELFAAIAAVAIEACGADPIKDLLETVIEMEGREPS